MRFVKTIPKTAKRFNETENDEVELYGTRKCAYLLFKIIGKFVDGKFVRVQNEKVILRLNPEELEKFLVIIDNFFRETELFEGKNIQNYIV